MGAKAQLRTLIQFLRQYRCLIVLDDVRVIFSRGQLAGYYHPQYQDYSRYFKQYKIYLMVYWLLVLVFFISQPNLQI
ncbi:hypothetical protein [Gloeothece citriformis]|uniref:hypothetical protein n=1 Tax=Gloeothece citriformis TaxID=2546356 RepID=UPI000173D7AE|nr:hypothetical protein [Gloeothece citriformis]